MSKENTISNPTDYQVGNTKYTVTPVFADTSGKESIESKIRRLIVQETKQQSVKA